MVMRLPNFLIVGAPRSGTTALYEYMGQHPDIFMSPIKEPNYFVYQSDITTELDIPVNTLEEYAALFRDAHNERIRGEASPTYLKSTVAAQRIRDSLPGVKLVAILRNPVERAFSHYMLAVRLGKELRPAKDAFREDSYFLQFGLYYDSLKRYHELFDQERMRICLYDDLKADSLSLIRELYAYLGVDSSFRPDVEVHHNVGSFPRNWMLNLFLQRLRNLRKNRLISPLIPDFMRRAYFDVLQKSMGEKVKFSGEQRSWLVEYYREDIMETQAFLRRDLTHWLDI